MAGSVRIISGQWRSRKLSFPDSLTLRPTPDRIRETLFNWLAPLIEGAYCLDLFAGSGALGFEALSRGAAQVVMLEAAGPVLAQLRANCALLGTENALLFQAHVPHDLDRIEKRLPQPFRPFDIVFLDPPFHQGLIEPCAQWLEEHHWLNENAHIYIETEHTLKNLSLPKNWEILRLKKTGQVQYRLAKRT